MVQGKSAFVLKENMKILKGKLRTWNCEVVGKIDLEVEEATKELNDLDHKVASELKPVSKEIVVRRMEASSKVWQRLEHKESIIKKKKSRHKWIHEGD